MSTAPGYQAPAVTVSAALPRRGSAAVLIVPVVGDGDSPAVVGGSFLDAESVGEIEVALRALGAKAGPEQLTRLHVPSLPVSSVLTVGLGPERDEWPAETIRRAAGVAARSLSGVSAVITTLSELHLEAAIEQRRLLFLLIHHRGSAIAFVCHRRLPLGNGRTNESHLGVESFVIGPLLRQVVFMINRSDRAFRNAGFAVDAFFRMDKQDCFTFVEAFDWANCDTVGVFAVKTGFGDNVRHGIGPFAQVACWQRYGDVSWQKTG